MNKLKIEPEVFLKKTIVQEIEEEDIYSDVRELLNKKASEYLNPNKIEEITESITNLFYKRKIQS